MLAYASGWFGRNGVTEFLVSIQAQQVGPMASGAFGVSRVGVNGTAGFAMQGRCEYVHDPQIDADGAQHTVVDALAMFYRLAPGMTGIDYSKGIPAQATCVMTRKPDGTASVGVRAVAYYTGEVLFSGDTDKNGLIDEIPLIRGGVALL